MALSKEVVLDRLKSLATGSVSEACPSWYADMADSAIALINSTDVAEVEKLRAELLSKSASLDVAVEQTGNESLARNRLAVEVESLRARVLELEAERDKAAAEGDTTLLGYVIRRPTDDQLRLFDKRLVFHDVHQMWMADGGSDCACTMIGEKIKTDACHAVYIGPSIR